MNSHCWSFVPRDRCHSVYNALFTKPPIASTPHKSCFTEECQEEMKEKKKSIWGVTQRFFSNFFFLFLANILLAEEGAEMKWHSSGKKKSLFVVELLKVVTQHLQQITTEIKLIYLHSTYHLLGMYVGIG